MVVSIETEPETAPVEVSKRSTPVRVPKFESNKANVNVVAGIKLFPKSVGVAL